MKKILFIHHGIDIGGASKSLAQLVNNLNAENICVLFLFKSEATKLFDVNIEKYYVNLPLKYFNHHTGRWYKILELHKIFIQIISWLITIIIIAPYWLIKLNPKLVYLNSSVLTDWLISAKILKIKTITHVRESLSDGYYGVRKKFISKIIDTCSNKIVYLSKENYNKVKSDKRKSYLIPNYILKPYVDHMVTKKKYDFVYIGGQSEIKGFNLITNLLERDSLSKYLLLGYYSNKINEKYKENKNVEIVGIVENALIYISRASYLLFPATVPHFPRPVIESYACGTIPISSDIEGIEEIITDGITGYIIKNKNFTFGTIKKIIGNTNYKNMIFSGYKKYKNNYSYKNHEKICNLLT